MVFCFALLTVYTVISLLRVMYNPPIPDEIWFRNSTAEIIGKCRDSIACVYTHTESILGYGTLYWTIHAISHKYSPSPHFLIIRLLPWLLGVLCLWNLLFQQLKRSEESYSMLLIILLWIVSPIAWWHGKISGPEFLSGWLVFAAIYLSSRGDESRIRVFIGAFLGGVAIGLKVNSIISVLSLLLPILPHSRSTAARENAFTRSFQFIFSSFERTFNICVGIALGFVAANPYILEKGLLYYIENIRKFTGPAQGNWIDHVYRVFFAHYYEWDAVYSAGLFGWFGGVAGILFLLFCIFKTSKRTFCVLILCLVGYSFIYLRSGFIGWYWFPWIFQLIASAAVLPILLNLRVKNRNGDKFVLSNNNKEFWPLTLMLGLSCIQVIPTTSGEFESPLIQTELEKNQGAALLCLTNAIGKSEIVYDFSESTLPLGNGINSQMRVIPPEFWTYFNHGPLIIDSKYKKIVFIFGRRVTSFQPKFLAYENKISISSEVDGMHRDRFGDCGGFRYYTFYR